MIPKIAGRQLNMNDQLYNTTLQLWGHIVDVTEEGTATIEFNGVGTSNYRRYTVTDGGFVNGKRVLYWHKPLDLDKPYADISQFQRLIDTVIKDGKRYSA